MKLDADEVGGLARLGDNRGCMALKGANRSHTTGPEADRWSISTDLEAVGKRWGIDPDSDSGVRPRRSCVKTIYFDYNATTTLDADVRAAMLPFLDEICGNPSSVHHVGRRARSLLDDARDRVAKVWRCRPSEVVFTSGGTESNNMAVFGAARALRDKGRHLITSTIEHHAVLHCFQYLEKKEGFQVTYLPGNSEGLVSPDDLAKAIRPDTTLFRSWPPTTKPASIQPVADFGEICRSREVIFHTDAVQWFGKEPFAEISCNSMPIWFRSALISFTGRKGRALFH